MNNYSIKILPGIDRFFVAKKILVSTNDQEAGYNQITYTQGYGQLSKAGATVQKGVTGHISIDLKIESLSTSYYKEVTDRITNMVSSESREELVEKSKSSNKNDWWFGFFAGGSSQKHDSDYYRNKQNSSVNIASTEYFNAAKELYSENKQTFSVKGDFDIVGQSYVPTTVFLFIETLTIKLDDKTEFIVPTNNTVVADPNGNLGSASTSGKINITPLSLG